MWRFFVWMIDLLPLTFAADLVSRSAKGETGLKGKPVKIRRYPRSCKKPLLTSPKGRNKSMIVEVTPLFRLIRMGRFQQCFKPEDLPGSLTIIQSFRVKGMECKSCKAFIFL
jgi:hypothetical protein